VRTTWHFIIAQGSDRRFVVRNTIREHRLRVGISQVELAAMIGVSRQTILSMEMEHSTPSLKAAFKVARALGATLTELFSYELRR